MAKTLSTIVAAGTSNAAGATTTGAAVDLDATQESGITIKMTNGATGPTIACSAYVEISHDGGTSWKTFAVLTATAANNAIAEWPVDIPRWVKRVRVVFKDNTGQAVTVEAFLVAVS
jgi:hypothetical protein